MAESNQHCFKGSYIRKFQIFALILLGAMEQEGKPVCECLSIYMFSFFQALVAPQLVPSLLLLDSSVVLPLPILNLCNVGFIPVRTPRNLTEGNKSATSNPEMIFTISFIDDMNSS
ncbi:hypothetical protein TorRG33x02_300520 [Trema orientale]|uniref:Uncharacterized protein n=1 Tax=Trema orientale TaxID=63057 RepID=A0A2P5C1U0_TREOI|nr:hypothetical protein TorRG33x02_300520 [Trema orientale]